MALNFKDPEVDRLARELAKATGESITESARKAFAEQLRRVRARENSADLRASLQDIIMRGRARQLLDARSNEEVLGYDEDGLPS